MMRELEVEQLERYLESAEVKPLLLDVRQPWEFEICKLEDSVLIPMSTIPSRLDELDKEQETVVICHHGIRSRRVALYLDQAGFNNVINLKGGMAAWAQNVDPDMATY